MRRWTIAVGGGAICVCCVLPAYEGADSLPGRAQGGDTSAGSAGRSNTTDSKGGDGSEGGAPNVAGATSSAGSGEAGDTVGGSDTGGGGGDVGNGGAAGSAGSSGSAGAESSAGAGGEGNGTGEVPCPGGVLGHCSAGVSYPAYPGYTLALVEDFPVPIDLNNDPIFTWSDGAPTDGQTGLREQNITFADGKLILTAEAPNGCAPKTTNAACVPPRTSYAEAQNPNAQANIGAMGVWSGELRSKYNNYRYGRYEAKYAAPIANPGQENTDNDSGNYLSTLGVFRSPQNVKWAEINIMLSPWHHAQVAGDVVSATFPGNSPVGYPAANASPFSVAGPIGYAITQEHVYAFNWTPAKIEWFLDGQLIREFSGSGNVPIPSASAKIMLSLWVFSGTTFGDGVKNKYPFSASYDYFRFYKLNTETTYPCANPPACLPAADKTLSAQNNPKELNYGQ